jgi:uncharacterized protein YaeQ
MAQGATIYVFQIDLANSDRAVYESLELRLARHPSEAADYLLARVLAYCLEYTEGIVLSNGLSDPDEPSIAVRDLAGSLQAWIDIGVPEAARLHKAGKAAARVAVYTHKDPVQLLARLSGEKIHRVQALELYAFDREWLGSLERLLERRMKFSLTIAAQHMYVSIGSQTLSSPLQTLRLPDQSER